MEGASIRRGAPRPRLEPEAFRRALPLSPAAAATVRAGRAALRAILEGRVPLRVAVIAGPPSLHDPDVAFDYARRLRRLTRGLASDVVVVMRTFLDPLVHDPLRDGSRDPNLGLATARQVLLRISELGVPCATRTVSPRAAEAPEGPCPGFVAPYLEDLVVCTASPERAGDPSGPDPVSSTQLRLPILNRPGRSADGESGVIHALDLHPRPLRAPLRSSARVRADAGAPGAAAGSHPGRGGTDPRPGEGGEGGRSR